MKTLKMIETIKVRDIILNVRVEGRMPCCYKCSIKNHIRASCLPPSVKTKERQEDVRMTGEPLSVEVEKRENEVATQMKTSTSVEEEEIGIEWETVGIKRRKRRNTFFKGEPPSHTHPTLIHIYFTPSTPCTYRPSPYPT